MERARAHLDVIGLQDHAALPRPVILKRQNEVLECPGLVHDSGVRLRRAGTLNSRGHLRASEAPSRRMASASRVNRPSALVEHEARQNGERRARTFAELKDDPLGGLAHARPERKDDDAGRRQDRERLAEAIGADDRRECAARDRALYARLQPVNQASVVLQRAPTGGIRWGEAFPMERWVGKDMRKIALERLGQMKRIGGDETDTRIHTVGAGIGVGEFGQRRINLNARNPIR